jgi:hypothetical protein
VQVDDDDDSLRCTCSHCTRLMNRYTIYRTGGEPSYAVSRPPWQKPQQTRFSNRMFERRSTNKHASGKTLPAVRCSWGVVYIR